MNQVCAYFEFNSVDHNKSNFQSYKMEEEFYIDTVPDGYDWGTQLPSLTLSLAIFNWDTDRSSKKLSIDDD